MSITGRSSVVTAKTGKFGDAVRSKTDVAMANEALCKVLCHNLVVLIHEVHELGFEGALWAKPPKGGGGEGCRAWWLAHPAGSDPRRQSRFSLSGS